MGHSTTVAPDGRQALERLKDAAFDLVLMDVQMPEMDGFAAARAIRDRERNTGKHIPIVAMTAHAMKGDEERCREAGMDDYVSKPATRQALADAIERVLSRGTPAGANAVGDTVDGKKFARFHGSEKRANTE